MAKKATKKKAEIAQDYSLGVPVDIGEGPFGDGLLATADSLITGFMPSRWNPIKMALDIAKMNPLNPPQLSIGADLPKWPTKGKQSMRKWSGEPLSNYFQPGVPLWDQGAGKDIAYGTRVGRAVQNDPDISRMTPYMTRTEFEGLPGSYHTMRKMRDIEAYPDEGAQRYYISPRHDANLNVDHMVNVALAGSAKKGWYEASFAALQEIFGPDDGARFAGLLAATSPQTSVEMNLLNTVNIWKNWTAAGRPTDPGAIKAIMGASVAGDKGEDSVMEAWEGNAITALQTPNPWEIQLSGPKVQSFMKNLQGDYNYSTNDTWQGRSLNILQKVFGGQSGEAGTGYLGTNIQMRKAAEILSYITGEDWTTANVQESMWSYTKTLMDYVDSKEAGGMTAKDVVDKNIITGEMIGSTPDFSTLLQDPTYAQPLVDAGILARSPGGAIGKATPNGIAPIQSRSFGASQPLPPRQDMLQNYAVMLDDIKRADLDTNAVNFPYETAPYAGSGHMVEMLADGQEEARRAYHSDPRADWIPEGMTRDVLAAGLAPKKVYETRQGQGAWEPDTGGFETNPVAIPSIVNPDKDNDPRDVVDRRRADYDVLSAFRAGMGAQGGVSWNYPTPNRAENPTLDAATIYYPKSIMPQQMQALAKRYPGVVLTDTGNSLSVYPYAPGDQHGLETVRRVLEDEGALSDLLGAGTRVRPMTMYETEGPARGGYESFEAEWKTPEKGKVTRKLIKSYKSASPDYQKYLDSEPVRQSVKDLMELDAEMGERGYKLRPDLQLMRQRFSEGGIKGLQDALKRGEPLANRSALDRFRFAAFG